MNSGNSSPSPSKKILLVLLGAGFALFISELLLRVIGFSYPNFWRDDFVLGSALRPSAEGWQTSEGRAYVKINRAGFRDYEHSQARQPNTIRIAILGDSAAEAVQVPIEATFWSVMRRALGRCPVLRGRNLEVLNFGVSNYGTAQELILLRTRVLEYCPDVVVLAFTLTNDFLDNTKALDNSRIRPFFELKAGKLAIDNSFRTLPEFVRFASWPRRLGRKLSDHSRIVQLIYRTRVLLGSKPDPSGYDDPFAPPEDPVWRQAWDVTEALLSEMHNEVTAAGAQFVLMLVPDDEQVYADPSHRARTMARWRLADLFSPDERFQAFGDREHFAVLDLGPAFQRYADAHHVFLNGFSNTPLGHGHWNPLGHSLAGEALARRLCETVIGGMKPHSCGIRVQAAQ